MPLPLRRASVRAVLALLLACGPLVVGPVVVGPALVAPLVGAGPTAAAAAGAGTTAVVETRVLGTSVQGRPIVAHRKGNPAAPLKVVVLGQTHGSEKPGVTTALHLVRSVPVSTRADVWVIPTMNPDGDVAGRRTNARGVDLNRNFPVTGWTPAGAGTVYWTGPAAGSEPETQAVTRFLDEVRPRFVTTIHTPLAAVGRAAKDPEFSARLGAELGLPVGGLTTCTGDPCEGGSAPATLNAWFNVTHLGAAVTVEYGRRSQVTTAYARDAAAAILRASFADPSSSRVAQRYEETGGAPASVLGRATGPELATPDGVGRYQHFGPASIYWHPRTDARIVRGAIRERWAALRWEASFLGYPRTDETPTPVRSGAYTHFQGGSIYWSPATGAHEVHGAIRDTWAALGWEGSRLGFPTSDEHDVPGGRRSTFEGGSITWDRATGATRVDHR